MFFVWIYLGKKYFPVSLILGIMHKLCFLIFSKTRFLVKGAGTEFDFYSIFGARHHFKIVIVAPKAHFETLAQKILDRLHMTLLGCVM